jgi:hypothetical protein
MTYTLETIEADRAAGLNWHEIAAKHGVTWQKIRGFWGRERLRAVTENDPPTDVPRGTTADVPRGTTDEADPFADVPRDVAEAPAPEAGDLPDQDAGTALGEDAARAYLPLLYACMDAIAGAGALWVLRRRLGDQATAELRSQAQQLATLNETERAALEQVLVAKIATIRLTPDEALLLTVSGIYAAKMLAVWNLEAPTTIVVAGEPSRA